MKLNSGEQTIARPPAEVYDFLVDLGNFPNWVPGLSDFEPPEKPLAAGHTIHFKLNGMGMSCTYVTLEPGRRLAYDIDALFGRVHVEIRLQETEPGTTHMTKENTLTPSWLGSLLAPVVRRADAKQLQAEIDLIKKNLESS